MTRIRVGLAIATTVLIGALAGGCQEKQASSAGSTSSPQDVKLHRLIALENRQFKAEIETLKKQIVQQKQQLAKYEKEKQQTNSQIARQKQQISTQAKEIAQQQE